MHSRHRTWDGNPGYGGRGPEPEWRAARGDEQGGHRPASGLFEPAQPKFNQFERSAYGHMERPRHPGDPRHSGSHAAEGDQRVRSRSADPGQSSYGGFTGQDPRSQRQELRDYTQRRPTLPKGYTRSDARLREDICERLAYSGLDVSEVEVSVEEGTAILEGSVSVRQDKHAIEDVADACLGVRDVENRIRVHHHRPTAGF